MTEEFVWACRQWNDYRQAKYRLENLRGVHWSNLSGGVRRPSPHYFLHAYVMCDGMVDGDLAHSYQMGLGRIRRTERQEAMVLWSPPVQIAYTLYIVHNARD